MLLVLATLGLGADWCPAARTQGYCILRVAGPAGTLPLAWRCERAPGGGTLHYPLH